MCVRVSVEGFTRTRNKLSDRMESERQESSNLKEGYLPVVSVPAITKVKYRRKQELAASTKHNIKEKHFKRRKDISLEFLVQQSKKAWQLYR